MGWENNNQMENLNYEALDKAFSYNTSGNGRCYYGAKIGNKTYQGERDWDKRWELMKDCIDYTGKHVLEIGCNMGIFISYLKKFKNIGTAVGIDQPDEMLIASNKRDTITAAKMLTKGLGIENEVEFIQMDLNTAAYEKWFPRELFDIVIVQSILKWIDDKERFLNFLSNFPIILYEGHDSDSEEIARFAKLGFKATILGKTQVGKSYGEDQTRTLILFEK